MVHNRECVLDKFEQKVYREIIKKIKRQKIGRLKKNKNEESANIKAKIAEMIKCQIKIKNGK